MLVGLISYTIKFCHRVWTLSLPYLQLYCREHGVPLSILDYPFRGSSAFGPLASHGKQGLCTGYRILNMFTFHNIQTAGWIAIYTPATEEINNLIFKIRKNGLTQRTNSFGHPERWNVPSHVKKPPESSVSTFVAPDTPQHESQLSQPPVYYIFKQSRKLELVFIVSLAAIFSALSSSIYFPALGDVSRVSLIHSPLPSSD